MAAPHSSQEETNFARLSRLLINIGTHVLRGVFDSIHPPLKLHLVLTNARSFTILKHLKAKRILNTKQWNTLYPSVKGSVNSQTFDITLLFLLLRNLCGLSPPTTGWTVMPPISDLSLEADLVRIKHYRNELFAHMPQMHLTNAEFSKYWEEISTLLIRLGGRQVEADIRSLLVEAMDPDDQEYYNGILRSWEERDDRLLKEVYEIKRLIMQGNENPPPLPPPPPPSVIQMQNVFHPGAGVGAVFNVGAVEHVSSDTRSLQVINARALDARSSSDSSASRCLTLPDILPQQPPPDE
ncbi:E3 ubiquitin-protein ligase DZIP3 [Exaiptasia diaphana]|uniref:DZIP3-like HEPN domain-containing protein n=1 Tax=Exaiptasia diaphana TaxID=2652724 RepID=A0A913X4L1_EXADI|nr:E3 ubiquitin-protein ligase DZIP3 [Exaiptasia diaphana]XP_020898870.1 E3 ubiquitin-protein ligase DZIP3 [Exaiptasia diaphana]XP_028514472.1 E3 ubiquitin-protein ligase DZIP3 [Exaiptasia diaphana]